MRFAFVDDDFSGEGIARVADDFGDDAAITETFVRVREHAQIGFLGADQLRLLARGGQRQHLGLEASVILDQCLLVGKILSAVTHDAERKHQCLLDRRNYRRHAEPHQRQRLKAVIGNHHRDRQQ